MSELNSSQDHSMETDVSAEPNVGSRKNSIDDESETPPPAKPARRMSVLKKMRRGSTSALLRPSKIDY